MLARRTNQLQKLQIDRLLGLFVLFHFQGHKYVGQEEDLEGHNPADHKDSLEADCLVVLGTEL